MNHWCQRLRGVREVKWDEGLSCSLDLAREAIGDLDELCQWRGGHKT